MIANNKKGKKIIPIYFCFVFLKPFCFKDYFSLVLF